MLLRFCRAALLVSFIGAVAAFAQGTAPSKVQFPGPLPNPLNRALVSPVPPLHTPVPVPTGTITLLDGGTALGSAVPLSAAPAFVSASFAAVFGQPDAGLLSSSTPVGAAWGDFDEDGVADLVLYNGTEVQTFLSATALPPRLTLFPIVYAPHAAQPLQFTAADLTGLAMQVLDVDGDGHLDLLLSNQVAYGKGDGTFGTQAVLPALATGIGQTYAVDVTGDGKPDIVAVNTPVAPAPGTVNPPPVAFTFTVLRNDGGGSFTSLGAFPLAAPAQPGVNLCCSQYNIFGLFFADLNGDGKTDILAESNTVPEVNASAQNRHTVLLNHGDGTFAAPQTLDTSSAASLGYDTVAFADLNGTGKLDLVIAYKTIDGNNAIASLSGAGDGTFAAPVVLEIGSSTTIGTPVLPVVAEDVNADGKVDVVLGSGAVALGDGDGTFTLSSPLFANAPVFPNPPATYLLLTPPDSSPISNATNAPLRSLLFLNLTSGADALYLPQVAASGALGTTLSPGTHLLSVQYSGDGVYAPSTSPVFKLTVAPLTPTVAVTAAPTSVYVGESATLTATLSALLPPGPGTVTFLDGATSLGTATLSDTTASLTTTFTTAGTHTIVAQFSGNQILGPATGTLTLNVQAPFATATGSGDGALTVAAGHSATTQLSISGNAGFSGSVTLACSGLPQFASCSFSPSTVTLSGTAPATVQLTVSTAAGTVAALDPPPTSGALTVLACGAPLLGVLLLPLARRSRWLGCVLLVVLSIGAVVGCGGGGSAHVDATPAGTYTFNVVSTSGSTTITTPLQLTVQ